MLIFHSSSAIIVVLTDLHPVSFRFLLLNMICLLLAVVALRYYFFVLENRFSKLNYQVLWGEMKLAKAASLPRMMLFYFV